MSIEAQLDRLNANLESLVGAIAANTSVAASIANAGNAGAPTPGSAPAEKPTRIRRTKEELAADAAKAAGLTPSGATASDVLAEAVVAETKPEAAPIAEAPQAAEDPFGDAPLAAATSLTLDDVRAAAFALRDATNLETARKFIAGFGVEAVKDLPADKYAAFIAASAAEVRKNAI